MTGLGTFVKVSCSHCSDPALLLAADGTVWVLESPLTLTAEQELRPRRVPGVKAVDIASPCHALDAAGQLFTVGKTATLQPVVDAAGALVPAGFTRLTAGVWHNCVLDGTRVAPSGVVWGALAAARVVHQLPQPSSF